MGFVGAPAGPGGVAEGTGRTLSDALSGLVWKVIALSLILSALGRVALVRLNRTPFNLPLALFLRIPS